LRRIRDNLDAEDILGAIGGVHGGQRFLIRIKDNILLRKEKAILADATRDYNVARRVLSRQRLLTLTRWH
jgi:hypothetical protein